MSKKPALMPPVFDNGGAPVSTTKIDDARFAAAEAFETPANVAKRVASGSIRTFNLDTAELGSATPASRRRAEVPLSTTVPESVKSILRKRYAETGETIRVQILLALRAQGIPVADEDLHDERKRR